MKLILVLIALFTVAFAQVSVGVYSDSTCTKIFQGRYYPPQCSRTSSVSSSMVKCSSDGKKAAVSAFSGTTCSGSISLTTELGTVGECTALSVSPPLYYKAWCAAILPTSGVISTRFEWIGAQGCDQTAYEFTYNYDGCHLTGNGTSAMNTCTTGLSGGSGYKTFSDVTCTTQSGTQKTSDNVKCAFSSYGQVCGFVSGVATTGLSFVILALISLFYL